MIDAKDAAKIAEEYFITLKAEKNVFSVSTEEVELSKDGKYWLITLGYSDMPVFGSSILNYKIIKINVEDGKVISMKIKIVKQ